ncbi:uncharacterized protein LOC142228098 [Haematobia irritans]|uniref:uncharacterized protein LOC142228098 n=1 Tax=Haematobia irritans TaxID=7368 RepID=UPI003F4F5686
MKTIYIYLISIFMMCESQLHGRQREWCLGDFAKNVLDTCAAKNNVGDVEINRLLHGNSAKNRNEKCFRACFLKECDYFEGYGGFKVDTPQRLANQISLRNSSKYGIAKKIVATCIYITPDPHYCDTAENLFKCIKLNSPFPLTLDAIY